MTMARQRGDFFFDCCCQQPFRITFKKIRILIISLLYYKLNFLYIYILSRIGARHWRAAPNGGCGGWSFVSDVERNG